MWWRKAFNKNFIEREGDTLSPPKLIRWKHFGKMANLRFLHICHQLDAN
jgi:hypothetical protein